MYGPSRMATLCRARLGTNFSVGNFRCLRHFQSQTSFCGSFSRTENQRLKPLPVTNFIAFYREAALSGPTVHAAHRDLVQELIRLLFFRKRLIEKLGRFLDAKLLRS